MTTFSDLAVGETFRLSSSPDVWLKLFGGSAMRTDGRRRRVAPAETVYRVVPL